jgi:Peptidase_C39 like family
LDTVVVTNNNYYGNSFGYSSNHIMNGGYSSDWDKANWGNDYNNSGNDWNNNPYDHQHYDLNNQDKAELQNHSDHICEQLDGARTCATMALSYVANYFGVTGLTSSDFAEAFGKNYTNMAVGVEDGLNENQIGSLMTTMFQSNLLDGSTFSIVTSLNNGNPILATITTQGSNFGHEVVIIGYDSNAGTINYMDSLAGGEVQAQISSLYFGASMYAVTGVQNNNIVNLLKNDTNDISFCRICNH